MYVKLGQIEVPWLPHLKANFLRLLLIILFLFHSQPLSTSTSVPLKALSISSEFAYIRKNSKKREAKRLI